MQSFEQRDIRRGADSERRQEDMPSDDPGELEAREKDPSNVIATSHDASVFPQHEMLREFRNRSL